MTAADPDPAARAALEALSTARVAQTSSTAERVADADHTALVELGHRYLADAEARIVAAFTGGSRP